jgi:hypothetical protein
VLTAELQTCIEKKVIDAVVERILREANVDAQVATVLANIEMPDADALVEGVNRLFEQTPDAQWRDYVEAVASECAGSASDADAAK